MKYELSAEDIAAVNRLLAWRAETVAKGFTAHVELSQGEHGFCATIYRYGEDGTVDVAYERTVVDACDRALERVRARHDTIPAPPPSGPSSSITPLEELMS